MEALQTATLRVVAVIAEGVPEKDTKRMIAYARANNKVIIGPATVGGVQVGRDDCMVSRDDHDHSERKGHAGVSQSACSGVL